MARKQPIIEEEEFELDLDDLDLEEEDDEEEEEEEVVVEPKKKAKAAPTAKKEKAPKAPAVQVMKASELAETLGTTPFKLRAWLRKTYPDHEKGKSWDMPIGSEELQEVIDAYTAPKVKAEAEPKKKKKTVEVK